MCWSSDETVLAANSGWSIFKFPPVMTPTHSNPPPTCTVRPRINFNQGSSKATLIVCSHGNLPGGDRNKTKVTS